MVKVDVVLDRVIDAGCYKTIDLDIVNSPVAGLLQDSWEPGGCSAVATVTSKGETLVGRNMDLSISDRPAYIVRTEVPGNYKTVGVGYSSAIIPSFDDIVKNGMPEDIYNKLPLICSDVLNEKGLYCETNMRNGEYDENGNNRFSCSGTNEGADVRTSALVIPRLVCEKCATVAEAVEYLKTIDFYTPLVPGHEWNFCFILADATGEYGLLEMAENKLVFLDKQHAQANFYITEEFADKEELKCGLGRYDLVMKGIDAVESEEDIGRLIRDVSYYSIYSPDTCKFDYRSDFVGLEKHWTTDYVLDPNNQDEIMTRIRGIEDKLSKMTRDEIEEKCIYWESIITSVTNCNNKTMTIRFFEDEERIYKMTL